MAGRPPPPQKHTHHDAGINTSLAGFRGSVETRSSGTVGATTNTFFFFFFFFSTWRLMPGAGLGTNKQEKHISLVALHLCSRICAHIVKSSRCLSLSIIRLSRIHINKQSHVTPMRQKKVYVHTPIKFGVSVYLCCPRFFIYVCRRCVSYVTKSRRAFTCVRLAYVRVRFTF